MIEPDQQLVEASEAFGYEVTGFGASYHRETDQWMLYTMPGTEPLGTISGYHCARLDWIISALRLAAIQATDGECQRLRSALERVERKLSDGRANEALDIARAALTAVRAIVAKAPQHHEIKETHNGS